MHITLSNAALSAGVATMHSYEFEVRNNMRLTKSGKASSEQLLVMPT